MKMILLKSAVVAVGAMVGSLLVAVTVVPMLGGVVDGNAWLMCIVCPLATAWPASAYTVLAERAAESGACRNSPTPMPSSPTPIAAWPKRRAATT